MEEMNMDKLAMISQLLGGNTDIGGIMEMAKTASMLGSMMNLNQPEPPVAKPVMAEEKTTAQEDDDPRQRQIKALNAAIPFLDVEYQKGLYMAVKLMEITKFQPEVSVMAMESNPIDNEKRRLDMINAVDSCLSVQERNKLGIFLKLAKAGTFLK